jgi:hypothetical protein
LQVNREYWSVEKYELETDGSSIWTVAHLVELRVFRRMEMSWDGGAKERQMI